MKLSTIQINPIHSSILTQRFSTCSVQNKLYLFSGQPPKSINSSSAGGNGGGAGDDDDRKSGGLPRGVFQKVVDMDMQELMDGHLKLQVDVAFSRHHDFMLRHGLDGCRKVLDIGCGNGYFASLLAREHPNAHFTGLDFNEQMIARAYDVASQTKVDNVKWVHSEITDFISQNESLQYDGVIMRFSAAYMSNIEHVLRALRQIIKSQGRLWIFTVELDHMYSTPQNDTFDLFKKATEKIYELSHIDGHIGSKFPAYLRNVGYEITDNELDPMSKKQIGLEAYQRFVLYEARLFNHADKSALSDEDLLRIGSFAEDVVPRQDFISTYGGVMLAAMKG